MSEIKTLVQPRLQPPRAISLKPIDERMPHHRFDCLCEMCGNYEFAQMQKQLKEQAHETKEKISDRINASRKYNRIRNINGYNQWILKHLMHPSNKICRKSLQIVIPESVYYKDGEASELFLNKESEDSSIKRIPREKLTNTLLQKILGERRKKYRDSIKVKLGLKKIEAPKKNLFGRKEVKKEVKDAVIIRYNDGYEQLATENELLGLLLKRKQDPIWKKILSIRNFINVPDCDANIITVRYSKGDERYEQLFSRAHQLVKNYARNILEGDKQYISDEAEVEFEQKLLAEGRKILAEYTSYKIVAYIQCFYDESIQKMTVSYIFNEVDQLILNQVHHLELQSLVKFEWTENVYKRMIEEEERRFFFSKDIEVTEELEKNSQGIEKEMGAEYEKMKEQFNLTGQDEDDLQQVANNQFFKKMHPDFHYNIADVLKDPTITLQKFKKEYLGYRKERSPIVKQFNSTMVKTIHDLSPRLKRAQPHHFILNSTHKAFQLSNPESWKKSGHSTQRNSLTARRLYSTLQVQ